MATKCAHTPGPWHYSEAGYKVYADDHDTVVASVVPSDRQHIDGPLLAAGPDLYEACKRVLRAIEWGETADRMEPREQAAVLRAAIVKAQGHE